MLRFAAACTLIVTVAACAPRNPDRTPSPRRDGCAFRVCIKALPGSESLVYTARNPTPVPATVGIHFERLKNLESTDPDTVIRTVAPGQSEVLTRLWIVDPQGDVEVRPVVSIDLGSDSTVHRPPRPYSLPFGGEDPRELISGFGGPTHLGRGRRSWPPGAGSSCTSRTVSAGEASPRTSSRGPISWWWVTTTAPWPPTGTSGKGSGSRWGTPSIAASCWVGAAPPGSREDPISTFTWGSA